MNTLQIYLFQGGLHKGIAEKMSPIKNRPMAVGAKVPAEETPAGLEPVLVGFVLSPEPVEPVDPVDGAFGAVGELIGGTGTPAALQALMGGVVTLQAAGIAIASV